MDYAPAATETNKPSSVSDELLALVFTWPEIEEYLADRTSESSQRASAALDHAFRVEARRGEFGSPRYLLFFDVRNPDSRHAAAEVRGLLLPLSDLVRRKLPVSLENIEVCPVSATPPIEGQLCLRRGEHPDIPDVSDLPLDEPPTSSVPLEEIDGYHLTPIEVPFYKELRETGLVFAVQPRIQGVDRPYRLDFLVLVGGAAVAVELDGHEYHKTKEQRRRDAERDRWFEARGIRTLRWTGSEVYADPRGCVAELVAILRASRTPK